METSQGLLTSQHTFFAKMVKAVVTDIPSSLQTDSRSRLVDSSILKLIFVVVMLDISFSVYTLYTPRIAGSIQCITC